MVNGMSENNQPSDVSPEERARLKALLDAHGLPGVVKKLGMGRDAVLRILATAPVHRGTVLVLREALARLDASATDGDR